MIDRIINTENTKEADTVILSAPYEGGASFMGGAAKGPERVIECLDQNLELFNIKYLCEPAKILKTAHVEIADLNDSPSAEALEKIMESYSSVYEDKKFTILLGGEHTVSLGALQAIAEHEDPKEITVLHIDAHQDLRDSNADYDESANSLAHSCVMRRAHELGFSMVQVGIRTFSKYEHEYTHKNPDTIKVFTWTSDVQVPEITDILEEIKTEKVYISIDIDGIDPAHMPGTGTPVPGGLGWNYTLSLLEAVFGKKNVLAVDIVEVAPFPGSVLTEWGASYLAYFMMAEKFKAKLR